MRQSPSERVGNRRADLLAVQQLGEAEPEEVHADAADALFGLEAEGHDRVQHAHHQADRRAARRGEPEVIGLERRPVGEERAQQHDALDAEVEHAAALAQGLAEGGEEVRRGQSDARRDRRHDHRDREEVAHPRRRRPWSTDAAVAAGGLGRAARLAPTDASNRRGSRPDRAAHRCSPTTKMHDEAVDDVINERCRDLDRSLHRLAPRAARRTGATPGSSTSGWSPPNNAATMPLKPAEPVNPSTSRR